MKRILMTILAGLAITSLTACKDEAPAPAPQAAPAAMPSQAAPAQTQLQGGATGTVKETMNAAGYTYVLVDTGTEEIWAAAPEFQVAVGDAVVVPQGMAMENYHSKTLDRDFEVVYFVNNVMVGGEEAAMEGKMPSGHPTLDLESAAEESGVDLSDVQKAEGGQTVSEIYAQKGTLTGQPVKVRGKVVKFSPQIMGKNWIHLQDGTGESGSNDLTVTTDQMVEIGDTILVSGLLVTDKDFGYGYKYDVIVEDAEVVVE